MNEITRIHLGRQPFVIAVDAHKQLRAYLDAIKEEVGETADDVIQEVELRMAELLAERGITGEKTILKEDVKYLKEQLGKPGDFKADTEHNADDKADTAAPEEQNVPKRLYRDTSNAMVSGVSAGLGAFFGIDAVIVRLIFIVLTLTGGWGIFLYIILWIVVPEAKTASERLNMRGKAVTVASLKELVDRADVPGAAERAGKHAGPFIEKLFRIFAVILGIVLCTVAGAMLFGIAVATTFLLSHHAELIQGVVAFPVGTRETIGAIAAGTLLTSIAVLIMLLGTSMANAMSPKKWSVPGWVVGTIIGVGLLAAATGLAVIPDAVKTVGDRYEAAQQTVSRPLSEFAAVKLQGEAEVTFVESDSYKVEVDYVGAADAKTLYTTTSNDTLTIDLRAFNEKLRCDGICINVDTEPEVTIYAPKLEKLDFNGYSTIDKVLPGEQYWTGPWD